MSVWPGRESAGLTELRADINEVMVVEGESSKLRLRTPSPALCIQLKCGEAELQAFAELKVDIDWPTSVSLSARNRSLASHWDRGGVLLTINILRIFCELCLKGRQRVQYTSVLSRKATANDEMAVAFGEAAHQQQRCCC
jgi:hypothetical protein